MGVVAPDRVPYAHTPKTHHGNLCKDKDTRGQILGAGEQQLR